MNHSFISMVAIVSLGLSSIASAAECSCQCSKVNLTLERPINLVLEPQYETAKVKEHVPVPKKRRGAGCGETQVHKLQYGPTAEESPLLKEKETPPFEANGAKYEKTQELYVAPAPDHVVNGAEAIVEKTPDAVPSPIH